MTRFSTARVADIAEVKGGKRLPANANLVSTPTSHPYIRGRDIRDGKITFADPMYVLDEDFEKIRRYTVDSGDVCITIVGNIGDVGITPPNLHRASLTENAVKLVNLREDFDAYFLMYALLTPDAQSQMKLSAAGAAQPKLGIYKVNEIKVPSPPLPIQRRIAGILSTYDELIENSQRRIKILESIARALYREWFVHFRFPGHEKVKRVPSALGEIPEGWEVKLIKDVCRLTMGQSPKSEFYNEVGDGTAFHQGVTDFGDRFPSDRLFCTTDGRIAEAGDILFSVRAPVGRMNIANKKIILGRGLSAIRHNQGYQAFIWEQLRNRFTKDDMIGNGAIFASVTKDDMQGIELICPPAALLNLAARQFEPLHSEIATLSQQIQNLRRTRDLLLPRLLSGKIDVEEMETVTSKEQMETEA